MLLQQSRFVPLVTAPNTVVLLSVDPIQLTARGRNGILAEAAIGFGVRGEPEYQF